MTSVQSKMFAVNGHEIQVGDVWKFERGDKPLFILILKGFPTGFINSGEPEYRFDCVVLDEPPKKMTFAFDCNEASYRLVSRLDTDDSSATLDVELT